MNFDPSGTFPRQLTRRQSQCATLVAKGMSSKEIGRELGISPSTVDNHIASIMQQFNLPNRAAIVRLCSPEQHATGYVQREGRYARSASPHAGSPTGGKPTDRRSFIRTGLKRYAVSSLLPSLALAFQCAAFFVLLVFMLRYFFDVRFVF